MLRFAPGWLAMLAALGCAPSYHTVDAYRFDAVRAAALEERARRACVARGEPAGRPSEPFRTDGCSMWPDASLTGVAWQACCVEHDMAYWCGGTRAMRRDADDALKQCVGERYRSWMGAVMKVGTRLGGAPWMPVYWRWGYGHDFPAGYSAPED